MNLNDDLKKIIKYPIFLFIALVGCNQEKITPSELEMEVINDVFPYIVKLSNFYNEFEFIEAEYYLNHSDSISIDSLHKLYNNEIVLQEKKLLLSNVLVPMEKEYFDIYSKYFSDAYRQIYGKEPTDSIIELKSNKFFDIDKITNFGRYKILNESKNKELESEEGITTFRFSRVYFYENNQKALLVCKYYCSDGAGYCHRENLCFVSKNKQGKWVVDEIHDLIVV